MLRASCSLNNGPGSSGVLATWVSVHRNCTQGDHLSGIPGSVRESGNFAVVRELSRNWPFVGECQGKNLVRLKLLFLMNKPLLVDGILYY